jgi:hypothetical protein
VRGFGQAEGADLLSDRSVCHGVSV